MPKVTAETNLDILKREQIAMLEGNRDRKILEPSNVALLTKLINNADNEKEVLDIAQMGVCYRKTGLYFDNRLEPAWDNEVRYFTKNDDLSFVTDENALTHKLIIGDNYDALLNLLITHKGKIDVIYIDPPYGKDSLGEFADTNYQNSITRDNLLSMLAPRLELAKLLLSKEGMIFVSIDDKNQAYIKCLMDEIFEEYNFVASCPRKTAPSVTTKSLHELQVLHDYVLIYAKSDEGQFVQKISGTQEYPYEDERGKYRLVPLQDNGPHGTRSARPNLWYPIYKTLDGRLVLEKEKGAIEYMPKPHKGEDGRWMWSKAKFLKDNQDLTIGDNGVVYIKHYTYEGEDLNKYQAHKTWLDMYLNKNGTTLLNLIFGEKMFDYPKPVELIQWCLMLHPNKNAVVLDFFGGSGTTGQAVLEQNRIDLGKRSFILVQMPENLDLLLAKKPEDGLIKNQISLCERYGRPHELSEITTERLRRVMTGKCFDGAKDFAWLNDHEPYGDNLEVLNIAKTENTDRSIVDKIDETLYGKDKMEFKDKIDWLCQNFEKTQKCLKEAKK